MGNAGIVIGLEVSRLARNNCDWHRLLEICALTKTLILDDEGLYDPCHFNDRLLLGMKGAMSEAELHMMKARLQGGLLNKAKRGEFRKRLPIGYVYGPDKKAVKDPDIQIQNSLTAFFDTFQRTGSAYLTVKHFNGQKIPFPRHPSSGPNKGQPVMQHSKHHVPNIKDDALSSHRATGLLTSILTPSLLKEPEKVVHFLNMY